jgi:hypothetical protein
MTVLHTRSGTVFWIDMAYDEVKKILDNNFPICHAKNSQGN